MATLGLRIQRDFPKLLQVLLDPQASSTASAAMATTTACLAGSWRRRHQDRLHPCIGLQPAVVHGSQQAQARGSCSRWQVRPVTQRLHDQDPAPRHCKGNPVKQPHRSSCGQARAIIRPQLPSSWPWQSLHHRSRTRRYHASSLTDLVPPLLPAETVSATTPVIGGRNAEARSQGRSCNSRTQVEIRHSSSRSTRCRPMVLPSSRSR
jgi:hypothetical protein